MLKDSLEKSSLSRLQVLFRKYCHFISNKVPELLNEAFIKSETNVKNYYTAIAIIYCT